MNANTAQDLLECGHPASPHAEFTTGYGTDSDGKRYCYECCAENDRQQMRDAGRITLYLTLNKPWPDSPDRRPVNEVFWNGHGTMNNYGNVSNWPGSLKLIVWRVSIGRHNIAGTRYDVWFDFDGNTWHGVQYGDNTQLCHCKRLKAKASI